MRDRVLYLPHPLENRGRLRFVTEAPRRRTILLRDKHTHGVEPRTLLFPWTSLAWGETRQPAGTGWLSTTSLRCWASPEEPRGLDDAALRSPMIPSVQGGSVCLRMHNSPDPVSLFWNSTFEQGAYHTLDPEKTTVALDLTGFGVTPRWVLENLRENACGRFAQHVLRCRAHAYGDASWAGRTFEVDLLAGIMARIRESAVARPLTEEDWRNE